MINKIVQISSLGIDSAYLELFKNFVHNPAESLRGWISLCISPTTKLARHLKKWNLTEESAYDPIS